MGMSKQRGQTRRDQSTRKRKDGSDHRHAWDVRADTTRMFKCATCGLTAHRESQHPSYAAKAEKKERTA